MLKTFQSGKRVKGLDLAPNENWKADTPKAESTFFVQAESYDTYFSDLYSATNIHRPPLILNKIESSLRRNVIAYVE
jgi:hypothetical protein